MNYRSSLISETHGEVARIFVASERGSPMQSLASVEALADQGLRGDRYSQPKNSQAPDNQVTLIELENIEAFTRSTDLALTPEMPRRNIVTRGIRLNDLCGKRFRVGRRYSKG
jgi:MOSC domain-containing protein YiiM